MSNSYQNLIMAATGCTSDDAVKIESIMRDDIFHSTLDWQSRAVFRDGARQAASLLSANRSAYEDFFAAGRAAFAQMKQAGTATQNTVAYDI